MNTVIEQPSTEKTQTEEWYYRTPRYPTDHSYELKLKEQGLLKNTYNAACYASFYNFRDNMKNAWEELEWITCHVNKDHVTKKILKRVLKAFCDFYKIPFEFREYDTAYCYRIFFGPQPNMGIVRFVLDSIRYSWETNLDSKLVSDLKGYKGSGKGFIKKYYTILSSSSYPGGHGVGLPKALFNQKYNGDINMFLDRINKYPHQKTTLWLKDHL